MKLVFLGTRGYIDPVSRRHRLHTSTAVSYRGRRVVIDCGETWRGRVGELRADAIVLTHPHPDHAFGLVDGAPCPVYATREAWLRLEALRLPVLRRVLTPRRPRRIGGIRFEAFPVIHSIRAPAVGYRITAGGVAIFYVPDVVEILDRRRALHGVRVYVGDGATIARPMVRREKRTGRRFGHTPILAQLEWCRAEGVRRMIVTHCGSEIVRSAEEAVRHRLVALGRERGVAVDLAYDGMKLVLRRSRA